MKDFVHIALETIDSTQIYAKQNVQTFSKDCITCITAEEQTAGKGRFQRVWISPPQVNLYFTFAFRLPLTASYLPCLSQVLGFSLAQLLLEKGLKPELKWPNDVLLNKKKLSGVLCETSFEKDFAQIYLGMGINVNLEASQTAQIDQPATSLKIETGHDWDKGKLLKELQKRFAAHLETVQNQGFAPFQIPFESLLAYKGQQIRCFDGQREWVGICHSLTAQGQLNLYLPDGSLKAFYSGELLPRENLF